MRTFRTAVILLITLALLIIGAFLPMLIAAATDCDRNQSGSRALTSIELNVSDANGESRSLSAAGNIALLRDGKMINITEKEASMTDAEVNAAVEAAMEEYIEAGIFDWFEYTAWNAQPWLCIDPDAPDNYGIFWTVTILNENEPYQSLVMDIDDHTGIIYSIRYDINGEYSLVGVWERNTATMDAVVHVYLNQLELLNTEVNAEPYVEYAELDGEVLCGRFCANDAEYGETYIEFYVTGTGSFWVYFPS